MALACLVALVSSIAECQPRNGLITGRAGFKGSDKCVYQEQYRDVPPRKGVVDRCRDSGSLYKADSLVGSENLADHWQDPKILDRSYA